MVKKFELEIFLGFIICMGLGKKPRLADYWSKNSLYSDKISKSMSRNHFELILRMWHFSDNTKCSKGDLLFTIQPLIDLLLKRFQTANIPNQKVCIDDTLVPFRGRLSFKQYIKNKRHRFGIKLYKLCTENGYTFNLKVYCGRDVEEQGVPVSSSVVMKLMENHLGSGRILYTDNFYSSVHLARLLLDNSTHLVGMLRSNRKLNPQDIVKVKLKKNEIIARESNTGVVVLKWKDKRDVLMISTVHTDKKIEVQTENRRIIEKFIKSKYRCSLSDKSLPHLLHLSTTNIKVNIDAVSQ